MLNFLVKIATYLDNKSHFKLAEEVDGLITKVSQEALVGPRGPLQREQTPATSVVQESQESLTSVLDKIGIMALNQGLEPSPDAAQSAENMNMAIQQAMGKDELPEVLKPHMNQLLSRLNMIATNKDPANPMRNSWQEVARHAFDAKNMLLGKAVAPVAQPKAAPKSNPMVARIQNNLGMKPTGVWDPETNNKFIAMMKSQPAYAQYMSGNTFKGNLQLAVRLTDALAELNKSDAPKQNVAQPAQQWHSKYFQLTPAAMKSLHEIEKYWPGTAQKELAAFDEYKEKGSMGKQMDQEMFEEMLAGRAKPA